MKEQELFVDKFHDINLYWGDVKGFYPKGQLFYLRVDDTFSKLFHFCVFNTTLYIAFYRFLEEVRRNTNNNLKKY